MSVLKRFTVADFRPGDMIVREAPPLSWLILEVSPVPPAKLRFIAIDVNNKGREPFEIVTSTAYEYPLQFKLLRKDE